MKIHNEENTAANQEELTAQSHSILEGIIAAARNMAEETQEIQVSRNGVKYFNLVIRPVSEKKSKDLRQKCTSYKKNRTYGVKMPEDTDMTKFRSMLIYEATVNKTETWDNKELWKALESQYPVVTGWETIDQVLLAGEKERIVDAISALSGYRDEDEEALEDTVKNSSGPDVKNS